MSAPPNSLSPQHLYGWSLLTAHAVVWLFFVDTRVLTGVTAAAEPYCWPYFEDCWRWRLSTRQHTLLPLLAYLVGILVGIAALWHGRWRVFWWSLLVLNVGLFALVSLDYRLRANEFYMLFWIQGVYLFTRQRRWTVPLAIIACYFWAGALKLNTEWLSGAVLYRDLWLIPPAWNPVACAYVVLLEMVLIWGLLARRTWILVVTLLQLTLFHLQSLSQIHWFYPLLMAAFLSWFVIDRWMGDHQTRADFGTLWRGRAPAVVYALLVVFGTLQFVPTLYRGDRVLTGQGRVFALHMFEARQQCEVTATPVGGGVIDLKVPTLSPRMVCDPLVYFNRAQNLCRSQRATNPAFDLHLTMRAKRTTDTAYTTIIDAPGFCAAEHEYRIFGNNVWLEAAWREERR